MENWENEEPKLTKRNLPQILDKRYGDLIGRYAEVFEDNIPAEEADLNTKEIELAIVLTSFTQIPIIELKSARHLIDRISQVKNLLQKKAKTDKFMLGMDSISSRGIMDTLDNEIQKIELASEGTIKGSRKKGDKLALDYLRALKEVAGLATVLQEENL